MKKDETEQQPVNLPGGGRSIIDWCRPMWMSAPDAKRPLRLEVTVAVDAPDAQGMAEGDEVTALDDVGFLLEKAVRSAGGGEHVMTVRGSGEQVFVFYLRAQAGLLKKRSAKEVLEPQIAKIGGRVGRDLRVAWFDDPSWSRLIDIYPAHDPARWKADRALLVHMAKARDAIHGRRAVIHRATFAEREQCRQFLQGVRKLKFKPDGGPRQTASGKFVAILERVEPTIATWHLHPVVLSVKALAVEAGGTYDGWETDLIESLEPPPLTAPRGG